MSELIQKAITLREPWAAVVVRGFKLVENRPNRTKFRGRIAIHAGINNSDEALEQFESAVEMLEELDHPVMNKAFQNEDMLQPGCIVGSVEIWDCVRIPDGQDADDFFLEKFPDFVESCTVAPFVFADAKRWLWLMKDAKLYKEPIQHDGLPGVWKISDAVIAQVNKAELEGPFGDPVGYHGVMEGGKRKKDEAVEK